MCLFSILLVAVSSISVASALIFWSRQIPFQLNVKGIQASLLQDTYDGYTNHVVVTTLDANDKVLVVIDLENFNSQIWLNCTVGGAPSGLITHFVGQTIHKFQSGGTWGLYPEGSPFSLDGYNVIDKAKMQYDNGANGGYALELQFQWDGGSAVLGLYNLVLNLQMGFVGA